MLIYFFYICLFVCVRVEVRGQLKGNGVWRLKSYLHNRLRMVTTQHGYQSLEMDKKLGKVQLRREEWAPQQLC